AASQLRDAHGGKRRRSAHSANNSRPRRYLHQPDLHARGAGPPENRLSQVSSKRKEVGGGEALMRPQGEGKDAAKTPRTEMAAHPEVAKGIRKFLDSLRGERHASPHTLRAYAGELQRFAEYLGPEVRWKDLDHVSIRGFLAELHANGLSKGSVARALAALRALFKGLAREGFLQQNPAKLVATPRVPKKLPRGPTLEEMNGLLDRQRPGNSAFPGHGPRIFALLYGCGLRNSELVGIELGDIEEANGVLLVRGKGKKQRYVPLEGAAEDALKKYREARRQLLRDSRKSTGRLFINRRGGPLTTRSV